MKIWKHEDISDVLATACWRFQQDKFIIKIKGNKTGNLRDCSFVNNLFQTCTGVDFMTDDNNNESKDFSP